MTENHTNQQPPKNNSLVRLSELSKFEVADGDPDVRGWDVVDSEDVRVGEVTELIADPAQMAVRYLEIELLTDEEEDPKRILVPIGFAELSDNFDLVLLKKLPLHVLETCPAYDGGPITRNYELAVRKAFVSDLLPAGLDFYAGQPFDASGIFGPKPTSSEPGAAAPDEII